jgi:transposase-like protein
METKNDLPETLMAAMQFFNEGDNAFDLLVSRRWPAGVRCPQCDSSDVRFIRPRKLWECKHCAARKQFSVRVGTIFEDSPISLSKWMCAFWLISNAKNGVSSYEIGRSLGVTQKTGWFMLQRLRLAMQTGSFVKSKLTGTVEVDESYIGGKGRFMHQKTKERRGIKGSGMGGKTCVMGLLKRASERQPVSKIIAEVLPSTHKSEMLTRIRKYVRKGGEVHTDALTHYNDVAKEYAHKVVDHAICYVKDGVHTNGLENFWSLLKRTIKGTYVSVEPFHLFRYLTEQVFRFNERKHEDGDQGRFLLALGGSIGKRLTYRKLIGEDAAGLQATA